MDFDLIVNMSGLELPPGAGGEVRVWDVPDPVRFTEERHREVRDQIERLVLELIAELRSRRESRALRGLPDRRAGD
jgi:protein-tyrosine-phosphatase